MRLRDMSRTLGQSHQFPFRPKLPCSMWGDAGPHWGFQMCRSFLL